MGKGCIAHKKRTVPQLEMLVAVVAVKLDELLRKSLTQPSRDRIFGPTLQRRY